jgi:mono/diheme cytochrome c family protein
VTKILVALLLAHVPFFAGEPLKFLRRGNPVTAPTTYVPAIEMTVWDPHENKEVKYKGYPANALFDKIYGSEWRKMDDVLFTCTDGYQPLIPVEWFLKHEALFAVERVGAEFSVVNTTQANEKVTLGPFYLVWNNLNSPELKARKAEGWPYQVTTVDLVDAAEKFPQMAPPKNSPATVKRGFSEFRQHCFACHKVNGDGGDKSIDLNRPVSVTEYWKEDWLKKWIVNAPAIRPGSMMPALPIQGTEGNKIAEDIIAYLKAIAARH